MKLTQIKLHQAAHEDGIWAAAWVPWSDVKKLVLLTGSVDETVKIWEGDDLNLTRTNTGNTLGIVSVAVHPDGSIAAHSSLDSIVRIFDTSTNETKAVLDCLPAEAWSVAFNPEGTFLAVAGGMSGSVKLYRTDSWKLEASLEVPGLMQREDKSTVFVLSVCWSSDGRFVTCGSVDGTVAVFDASQTRCLHLLEGHHAPVRSLTFSPADPRLLFTASDDCHVHMFDAVGRSLISVLSGHSEGVLSVSCSADGSALASGSSDRTVRLWDLSSRTTVQSVQDHEDRVWAVAFSSGQPGLRGQRLASAGEDGRIALYDFS